MACTVFGTGFVHASSLQDRYDAYDVQFEHSASINTTHPDSFPDPEELITDLNDLINIHITDQADYNAHAYWYVPKVWVFAPVVVPTIEDNTLIAQWEVFNHFPYLQRWILHYYGNDPSQGPWNMILAAHSAFKWDDTWRYNTIFQILPVLQEWDLMHYYLRQDDESYTRFTYQVQHSFEVEATDVSILHQNEQDTLLTAYTCYPIWTIDNRWVVKAPLIETIENFALLDWSFRWWSSRSSLQAQVELTRDIVPDDQEYELFTVQTATSPTLETTNETTNEPEEHWSAEVATETIESVLTQRQQLIGLLLTYPVSDEFVRATKPALIPTIALLQRKVARLSQDTLKAIFVRIIDAMIDDEDLTEQEKIQRIQVFMVIYQSLQ